MARTSRKQPSTGNRRTFLKGSAALALSPVVGALSACGGGATDTVASASGARARTAMATSLGVFGRSMTINLANRIPDLTLAFGNASSQSGSTPQSSASLAAPGQSITVSASSNASDCTGSFSLSGGAAAFAVSYVHPFGSGATTVGVSPSSGYIAGTDAATYSGHAATANVNLYRAVPATAGGFVVPLGLLAANAWNNCQDFANSMFGGNVRTANVIQSAYQSTGAAGFVPPADFTGNQMASFVAQWTSRWINGSGNSVVPSDDAQLLDALKRYVTNAASNGPLTMWVPQIAYQAGTSPAAFYLSGYRAFPFVDASGNWIADSVSAFLTLFAAGSHLVAISATSDIPAGVSVQAFDDFMGASGVSTSADIGNSHYASVVNTTGRYYLSVGSDFAPANCGLILSFLYGRTVNNALAGAGAYNTFIQLEGWQAGGSRHNADYATYQATLWNISTFGASPYSEKRATSVFLAPAGWTPQVYQTTRMMPYVGAYAQSNGSPQQWLNTALVSIPADAPPLPARYVGG
ncbi:hypothetical protein [Trinickia diaoshuihuensis]|uniref:hypothetical protein n=1 Tax=Trinickia diaoshuihuensis TaxID=2292265 RepID=UPI000E2471A8|nr:hypothetical protein [Trinickia diaoshuihuensis]